MKDPAADTIKAIDRFLARTGMKESRLGRNVANNSVLIPRIRRGDSVKKGTLLKVQEYIRNYK